MPGDLEALPIPDPVPGGLEALPIPDPESPANIFEKWLEQIDQEKDDDDLDEEARRLMRIRRSIADTFRAIMQLIERLDARLYAMDDTTPAEAERLWPMRDRLVDETMEQANQVMRLLRRLDFELRRRDAGREPDSVGSGMLAGIARVIDLFGDRLWEEVARLHEMSEAVAGRLAGDPALDPASLSLAVEEAATRTREQVALIRERRDGLRERRMERHYRELLRTGAEKRE